MTIEMRVRKLILALLAFGLVAISVELAAVGHYEDTWQLVPIGLSALTVLAILVHAAAGGARGLLPLQVLSILLIGAGAIGIFLHYDANLAFQRDTNPDLAGWALYSRVLHSIAPPSLAPGVMAQLGFLGLIYIYRHPARRNELN